jgi:hypothetical protein
MGIAIDGFGNEIDPDAPKNGTAAKEPEDPNDLMFMQNKNYNSNSKLAIGKEYTPIDTYKPSGNLIYNEGLLKKIEDKSRR